MKRFSFVSLALFAATALVTLPAAADQADKDACVDKAEGDDCTRGDGGPGTCVQDVSDAVLTCDDSTDGTSDDGSSDDSSDDSSGCSAAGKPASSSAGAFLAVAALVAATRRRDVRG